MNVNFEVTDTKRVILSVHKGCGNGSMIVFTPYGKGNIVNDTKCIDVKQIMASTPGLDIVYDRRAYVLDVDVNDGLYVNDERRKLESDFGNTTPKKCGDKSAVAVVKVCDSWGCVSQDAELPESVSIYRKGTTVLGPIRRVRFTRAALRQTNIRDNKGPLLGKIQVKSSHQRSHHAMIFEDRSQEEIERRERCARGDAWRLAENIHKLEKGQSYILFTYR